MKYFFLYIYEITTIQLLLDYEKNINNLFIHCGYCCNKLIKCVLCGNIVKKMNILFTSYIFVI
jgi:hypothetical protein